MHHYITGALAALSILGILYVSHVHTAYLNRVADCVVEQAYMQDYAGNVYSRDAWETFAPLCK
jgi:hypothetical protein